MKQMAGKTLRFLFFTVLMGLLLTSGVSAASYQATNVSELATVISSVTEDSTITLSPDFTTNLTVSTTLTNPGAYQITIEGNGLTLSAAASRHFTVTSSNGGTITLQNLIFSGSGSNGGINIPANSSVTFKNCVFIQNKAYFGAAMSLSNNAAVTLDKCSFIDNLGEWAGYHGGAIAANQQSNITLNVKDCYFKNNVINNAGVGGTGGAIGFYLSYGSKITIDGSVFEGNQSTYTSTTSDGGAIAIKSNNAGNLTTFTITNSTFDRNTTKDDGGAILIESYDSISDSNTYVSGTIANCTFIKNKGAAYEDNSNGGAVQMYGKGVRVNFFYNTFYGNAIGGESGKTAYGGAIGFSGGTFRSASGNLANNLFVDNANYYTGTSSTYQNTKNVFATVKANAANKGGNLGYDNQVATMTYPELAIVCGAAEPIIAENGVQLPAGSDLNSKSYQTTVKTLVIAPNLGDGKLYADGAALAATGTGADDISLDQRGRSRSSATPDAGALEIKSVKFDANGGEWSTITASGYNDDGDVFYVYDSDSGTSGVQYAVNNTVSQEEAKVTAPSDPEYDGYTFVGWSLQQFAVGEGSLEDCVDVDTELTYDQHNQTLYAVWSLITYSVRYDANGGIGSRTDGNLTPGTDYTVLAVADTGIYYANRTFVEWNTDAEGTGVSYEPGESFTLTANTTLYAQWRISTLNTKDHLLYILGYPGGSVRVEQPITRAEAAMIFYRLLLQRTAASSGSFSDVADGAWYAPAVNTLATLGIVKGYANGTFGPDKAITRAEFATMSSRFDNLSQMDTNVFEDVPADHWALVYINSAYAKGWVNGYPDGSFRPENKITRAEVITIVNKLLDRAIDDEALAQITNPYNDITADHWAYADVIEASVEHQYIRDDDGHEIWQIWNLAH